MWISFTEERGQELSDYRKFINLDNVEFILMIEDIIEFKFKSGAHTRIGDNEKSFKLIKDFLVSQLKEYRIN